MSRVRVVRDALVVTVLSVLVWVFAESESLTDQTVRAEVSIEPALPGEQFVRVGDGQAWNGSVTIDMQGSASALAEVEAIGRAPIRLRPGSPAFPDTPGETVIDLETALRSAAELRGRGVTIRAVDPPTVRVEVDRLVARTIPVRIDAPDAELDGAPEASPPSVTLTLPARVAATLPAEVFALGQVSESELSRLIPGRPARLSGIPLRLSASVPDGRVVRLQPPMADASLTVRSRSGSLVLPSVPIAVRLAASELGRWEVAITDAEAFIADVRVTGPADLIERIRRNESKVVATLALSFEELERGITSKEVSFSDLPTPLRVEADRTVVGIRIVRREPPPPVEPDAE